MQDKFLTFQRQTDARLDRLALPGTLIEVIGKKTEVVRSVHLDVTHRGFGFFGQKDGVLAVIGKNTDPQAARYRQIMTRDIVLHPDRRQQFLRNAFGLLGVMDITQHQDEFIRAIAKYRVGLAHCIDQAVGDSLEHFIARGMAQGTVDALKAVQADEHHRQLHAVTAGQDDRLAQTVAQQGAVGQIGQDIVLQQVRDVQRFLNPLGNGSFQAEHAGRHVTCQLPFHG